MSSISKRTLARLDRAEVHKDPVADRRNKALAGLDQQRTVLAEALEGRVHTVNRTSWKTDTAKASTGECEMNCSTARYSTRCGKPKLLSKDGGTITTPNDPIVHWDIARLRQKPTSRWTKGQSCTNSQIEPLKWGCSKLC